MKKLQIPVLIFIVFLLLLANLYLLFLWHPSVSADMIPQDTYTEQPQPEPELTPAPTPEPTPVPTPSPTPYNVYPGKVTGKYFLPLKGTGTQRELPGLDDGLEDGMDYIVCIPENATANMPLLVFLHGDGFVKDYSGLRSHGIIDRVKWAYGDSFPFILLIPHTSTYSWIKGDIPATLLGLIDFITDEYDCNPDKIMLTGHSRGAIGTWHLVSNYPDRFSCAVPVSCGLEGSFDYAAAAKVPIRAYAGRTRADAKLYSDDTYNYTTMQQIVSRLNEYGSDAVIIPLDGYTHGQTQYDTYSWELFDWMLRQDKSTR